MLQRALTLGSKKIVKKSLSLLAFTEQFPFHIVYRVALKHKSDHVAFLLKKSSLFPSSSKIRFVAPHKLSFSLICYSPCIIFFKCFFFFFICHFSK